MNKDVQEIGQEILTEDSYRQKIRAFFEIHLREEKKRMLKTEGKVPYKGSWVSLKEIEELQQIEEKHNRMLYRDLIIFYLVAACFLGCFYKIILFLLPK